MTAIPAPGLVRPQGPPLVELIAREDARRHRRRMLLWLSIGGIVLLIAATWAVMRPRPVPIGARFRTQEITQGTLVREVRATGNVQAVTTVQVGAEVSGRIATVSVDFNSRVRAGQELARHGCQYTSLAFGDRCQRLGVRPSRGTVGDAYDNAMAESFFATLECERLDRRTYRSHTDAKLDLFQYIEGWYNPHRRHSGIGNQSPINYERLMSEAA